MSQFTDIINEKKPTLVDFYATWCGPCKMQGPIIEEVKAAVGDEANVLKIDVKRRCNKFLAFLPCGPRAELYFRLCLLYICADRSFSRMMRLTRL